MIRKIVLNNIRDYPEVKGENQLPVLSLEVFDL